MSIATFRSSFETYIFNFNNILFSLLKHNLYRITLKTTVLGISVFEEMSGINPLAVFCHKCLPTLQTSKLVKSIEYIIRKNRFFESS